MGDPKVHQPYPHPVVHELRAKMDNGTAEQYEWDFVEAATRVDVIDEPGYIPEYNNSLVVLNQELSNRGLPLVEFQ